MASHFFLCYTIRMLFPEFENKVSGYVNLDTEARQWMQQRSLPVDPNPLLDPDTCQQMVSDVHKKYSLDFSYGGWLEDRSFLWKGSYLDETGGYIHLGVDFNVPEYTKVAASFDAEVVRIDDDYPIEGGWGNRIIVKHAQLPLYFIYAHLDEENMCQVGDKLIKNQVFAKIGKTPFNGKWFPHLHLQTINAPFYEELLRTNALDSLDGYGAVTDIAKNAALFKDPLPFVEI